MATLHQLLTRFKDDFAHSKKGEERSQWFIYTIFSIIFPFTSSKTSNLLRCLNTVFGFHHITKRRFYTFMALSKIPWERLWKTTRKAIPTPLIQERLLVALDDSINPKVGKKIFGCHRFFDHAAKQNQSRYPWAQNIVAAGLLAKIKGRWACLPPATRFYHPKKAIETREIRVGKDNLTFQTKLEQAVEMLVEIHSTYHAPILAIADSWFGNNGLWAPARKQLGADFHLLFRLRSNNKVFDLPEPGDNPKKRGRPRKYGTCLGNTAELARQHHDQAQAYERSWPLIGSLCSKPSSAPSEWSGSTGKRNGSLCSVQTYPSQSSKSSSTTEHAGRSNQVSKSSIGTSAVWRVSGGIPMQWSIISTSV